MSRLSFQLILLALLAIWVFSIDARSARKSKGHKPVHNPSDEDVDDEKNGSNENSDEKEENSSEEQTEQSGEQEGDNEDDTESKSHDQFGNFGTDMSQDADPFSTFEHKNIDEDDKRKVLANVLSILLKKAMLAHAMKNSTATANGDEENNFSGTGVSQSQWNPGMFKFTHTKNSPSNGKFFGTHDAKKDSFTSSYADGNDREYVNTAGSFGSFDQQ